MFSLKGSMLVILKLNALVLFILLCGAFLYGLITFVQEPYQSARTVLEFIGRDDLASRIGIPYTPPTRVSREDFAALVPNYDAINNWVIGCMGYGPNQLPQEVAPYFENAALGLAVPYADHPPKGRGPSHQELALVQLNNALLQDRASLVTKVRASALLSSVATWIAVGLGLITTILVSLSSTEFGKGEGQYAKLIRIFAIVFPALSTAAAAIISFYAPQQQWSEATRTLASETQLHNQIALAVWSLKCPASWLNDQDPIVSKFTNAYAAWSKQYTDIQTVSNATGTSSQDTSSNPNGSDRNKSGAKQAPPKPAP